MHNTILYYTALFVHIWHCKQPNIFHVILTTIAGFVPCTKHEGEEGYGYGLCSLCGSLCVHEKARVENERVVFCSLYGSGFLCRVRGSRGITSSLCFALWIPVHWYNCKLIYHYTDPYVFVETRGWGHGHRVLFTVQVPVQSLRGLEVWPQAYVPPYRSLHLLRMQRVRGITIQVPV